jgi:hydrogenase maturation protease
MVEVTDQEATNADSIRVFALGSPHGDDRVAWCVAERLQCERRLAGALHKVSSPWDLIDHLHSVSKVLILDACHSGSPVGTLIHRNEQNLEESRAGCGSTHAGSISESLRLARVLGKRFGEVIILAVEIDNSSNAPEMSQAARDATRTLEAEARHTLSQWHVID